MTSWHIIVSVAALCGLLGFVYFDLLKDKDERRKTLQAEVDKIIREFDASGTVQKEQSAEVKNELETPEPREPFTAPEPRFPLATASEAMPARVAEKIAEAFADAASAGVVTHKDLDDIVAITLLAKSSENMKSHKKDGYFGRQRAASYSHRKSGNSEKKGRRTLVKGGERVGRPAGEPRDKPLVRKHSHQ